MVKKAVLIGINYPGTEGELLGCVNDVKRAHKSLVELYGVSEENITELIDTDMSKTQPTGKNILHALSDLVGSAKPGDVLFVHYSGHGTRVPSETGEDDDTGFDECIVPSDSNYITDDAILLSGCQSYQKSKDIGTTKEEAYGSFTNSIHTILAETKGRISYNELVLQSRKLLEKGKGKDFQSPGLYCTDTYLNAQFIC